MDPLKILIVEDEPLFREMLRHTLDAEPGLDVVGVATDGESAVAMAAEKNPDAVIMDIELPGEMDGIDAALKIKERRLDTGIVILSVHKDRRYVSSLPLSETPGWAYLLKQNDPRHGFGATGDSGQRGRHGGVGPRGCGEPATQARLTGGQVDSQASASVGADRPRIQQHSHSPTADTD